MSKQNEEMEMLKKKIADLESKQSSLSQNTDNGRNFFNEVEKIRRTKQSSAGEIPYKDVHDHKNISLWRKDGKRIGPLHPANAEATLKRFWESGIILTVDKPTEEQISEYKKTDEYKRYQAQVDKDNENARKSLKNSSMEKLTEQIASIVGTKVSELNKIKSPSEVGI